MKIDIELVDGWLQTIAVDGELDAYTAPDLTEAVTKTLDGGVAWLVVDLTEVEYIDSVGLGILIGGAKRAGEKNGDMAVSCSRPNVRRVFEVSGTADLLNVVDGLEDAIEALTAARSERGVGTAAGEGGSER